jgi:nitrilase
MKASVIQMVSTSNLDQNLKDTEALLTKAKQQGSLLAVLPEMFAHFGEKNAFMFAKKYTSSEGKVRSFLSHIAKKLQIWIIAGTMPVVHNKNDEKPYATSLVYDNEGKEVAHYDKIHLFDVDVNDQQGQYRESNFYHAGNQTVCVDSPLGKLGLTVCYDLRFPELFRNLVQQGATLIAVPSAFTYETGSVHWLPLLQARAIENQCYILAANQGGQHSEKRRTWGHSCIIDPWGRIMESLPSAPGVITHDIDLTELASIRSSIPCLQHRQNWL